MLKLLFGCTLIVTALTFCVAINDQPTVTSLTNTCLNCIAESISACDVSINCRNKKCGLFKITMPYWIDSGKPTVASNNPYDDESGIDRIAFTNCATDYKCSIRSVRGYMDVYKKDCNGDGVINCNDYMAIHKNGPGNCGNALPKSYTRQFNGCIDREETKSFITVDNI